MAAIRIRPDDTSPETHRFRAVAGPRHAVGRTMGEALDALTTGWPSEDGPPAAVLIQRFAPDDFFSAAQRERLQDLFTRRDTLGTDERRELEDLVDAESDATIARTQSLVPDAPL